MFKFFYKRIEAFVLRKLMEEIEAPEFDKEAQLRVFKTIAKTYPEFIDFLKAIVFHDKTRYYFAGNEQERWRVKGERIRAFVLLKSLERAMEKKKESKIKNFFVKGRYE